jgi:beta-glucosidase
MKALPKDIFKNEPFYWGAATSAFQIEGSPLADDAVASDWYKTSHMPTMIDGATTADIACDHYRRWEEDVRIMRDMGLNSYRFSVAWSRIYPASGKVNQKGLDFYNRLIDRLCESGITPFLTLFHWDLPIWLDDLGGWVSDDSPKHFGEYSSTLFKHFGDRVKHWITLNEPFVYYHSYINGWHWPFRTNAYSDMLKSFHHEIEGHQLAVDIYKKHYDGKIGATLSYNLIHPASNSQEDVAAAKLADGVRNRWFQDRIFRGEYPKDVLEMYGQNVPKECFENRKLDASSLPDFIGLNYYAPIYIKFDKNEDVFHFVSPNDEFELQPSINYDATGLTEMVKRFDRDYGPIEIFITENGYLEYGSALEGKDPTEDYGRIEYLSDHLHQVRLCREQGYPVHGYFHWSLLDNFEWRWGMNRMFGLIYVDPITKNRIPKKSAYWYKKYIENSRIEDRQQNIAIRNSKVLLKP